MGNRSEAIKEIEAALVHMRAAQAKLNYKFKVCRCCEAKRYISRQEALAHDSLTGSIAKLEKWAARLSLPDDL